MRAKAAAAAGLLALAGCAGAAYHSPGGAFWRAAYNGYGKVVIGAGRPPRILLRPRAPAGGRSTHAALVLSARSLGNLDVTVRLRTTAQLRRPRPNPWEAGWLLWHYTGDRHFYYLVLKPDGWELGKEAPGYPGGQRYLATGSRPRFPAGRWYTITVSQRGAVIKAAVDGRPLVRFADTRRPYLSGRVGLYTEDAAVIFRPLTISSR
ncbi:MAG TPA: family 16 glycoside hydrolase [Streptosporangiaceae bacterium]